MSDQPTNQPVNQPTFQPASRLPDLPSELLTLALKDLRLVMETEPRVSIDMDMWLVGQSIYIKKDVDCNADFEFSDVECTACLAGAMMIIEFASESKQALLNTSLACNGHYAVEAFPSDLKELDVSAEDVAKLSVVNKFREGMISSAYSIMSRVKPFGMKGFIEIADWDDNQEGFFNDMECLIEYLKSFGE